MEEYIYQRHKSKLLNELYSKKSYQGANPFDAKILFVGRDPNWAYDLDSMDIFDYVSDYLSDGVSFWKTHNIHHPFLLPNYKGGGKRYHTIFSKLKVDSNASSKISFVELLGFPTIGNATSRKKIFLEYLISEINRDHLIELDSLLNDLNKTIFIAWGLIDDFKFLNSNTGLFKKFAKLNKNEMSISDLNQIDNIFIHRHFSDAISNKTLDKMAIKLKEHL